jgi:hypothetical protein
MTNFFFRLFSLLQRNAKLSTLSITREGAFFNGFKKKKKRPTERI